MEWGQALIKSLLEQTERREEVLRKRVAALEVDVAKWRATSETKARRCETLTDEKRLLEGKLMEVATQLRRSLEAHEACELSKRVDADEALWRAAAVSESQRELLAAKDAQLRRLELSVTDRTRLQVENDDLKAKLESVTRAYETSQASLRRERESRAQRARHHIDLLSQDPCFAT